MSRKSNYYESHEEIFIQFLHLTRKGGIILKSYKYMQNLKMFQMHQLNFYKKLRCQRVAAISIVQFGRGGLWVIRHN